MAHQQQHHQPHSIYAAGLLPITWYKGKALFLVGRDSGDKNGGYSDFGGRSERVDKNIPLNTAIREWSEETLGMIIDAKALKQRLQEGRNVLLLKSSTQNNYTYYCYVFEIPYVSYLRRMFARVVDHLRQRNTYKIYIEKNDVQYVPLEVLLDPTFPKRSVFKRTIEKHRRVLMQVAKGNVSWPTACDETKLTVEEECDGSSAVQEAALRNCEVFLVEQEKVVEQ